MPRLGREEEKARSRHASILSAQKKGKEKSVSTASSNDSRAKDDTKHNGDDAKNRHHNAEAPPFELAGTACVLDALGQLYVSGLGVVLDLFCVLLGLLDLGVLQHDCGS